MVYHSVYNRFKQATLFMPQSQTKDLKAETRMKPLSNFFDYT